MLLTPDAWRASPSSVVPFSRTVELAIVVPTFNERGNLEALVARVAEALTGINWEMIVVDDDSPDGTAAAARAIGRRDPRVRLIRRIGRRGLSSACIEGMLSTGAPVLAVMDGDLQHDPALLPAMFDLVRGDSAELVVASRNVAGGSFGGWGRHRAFASWLATRLGRSDATATLSDPMSGYFMLRRRLFDDHVHALSGVGFKILLDLVLSCHRELRVREVPLVFGKRLHGASKLGPAAMWHYALLLADKRLGRVLPWAVLTLAALGAALLGANLPALLSQWIGLRGAGALSAVAVLIAGYGVTQAIGGCGRRG